eukprot:2014381-Amphidinium_carterae.1
MFSRSVTFDDHVMAAISNGMMRPCLVLGFSQQQRSAFTPVSPGALAKSSAATSWFRGIGRCGRWQIPSAP